MLDDKDTFNREFHIPLACDRVESIKRDLALIHGLSSLTKYRHMLYEELRNYLVNWGPWIDDELFERQLLCRTSLKALKSS